MSERFLEALGTRFVAVLGWVLGIGGTVWAFLVADAYPWLGGLAVVAGLVTATAHAYAQHQRAEKLGGELLRERAQGRSDPGALLRQIEELVGSNEWRDRSEELAAYADYVLRMIQFESRRGRKIELRTFTYFSDRLFATARIPAEAREILRLGDEFLLVLESGGVKSVIAVLIVNQDPAPSDEYVMFRVGKAIAEGIRQLEDLVRASGGVSGITGYTIRPLADLGWYAGLESDSIHQAILRVATGRKRDRRQVP